MNKVISIVMLAAMATLTVSGAAYATDCTDKVPVSPAQYRTLINQCRYADGQAARQACRAEVRRKYTIGAWNPALRCRTYSSVTVCGDLKLSPRQRACVREYVRRGLTYQRAEVECYVFGKGR